MKMILNKKNALCSNVKYVIITFLCCKALYSQTSGKIEYAPVGARWVYDLISEPTMTTSGFYLGYIEYLVEKDTNVMLGNQNILCKKIIVSDYKFKMTEIKIDELIPYTCSAKKYNLTFKRNDTIFWLVNANYINNVFYPIIIHYNHTSPNNRVWTFFGVCEEFVQYYTQPLSISVSPSNYNGSYQILNIDTILLFNDTLRRYKVHLPGYHLTYYYENLGFLDGGLIPFSTIKFYEFPLYLLKKLRCYYDPTNGWLNLVMGNCYYHGYPNSAPEFSTNNALFYCHDKKIYFLNTENTLPFRVKIYDIQGKKLIESDIETPDPMPVMLNAGFYLLEVNNKILKIHIE